MILEVAGSAAAAMLVSNVLGTVRVQAEAANKAHLSGLIAATGQGFALITTVISVTALQGHGLLSKAIVVAAVMGATYLGTTWGVSIGKRIIRRKLS